MSDDEKITPRAEVLREAESLICGDRNDTYGTPTQNFTNIAALWNVQFGHLLKDGAEFEPKDVALALIHVKMARTIAQPKRDNFVDLAGYAACGYETTVEPEPEPTSVVSIDPVRGGTWVTGGRTLGGSVTINSTSAQSPEEIAKRVQQEIDTRHRLNQASNARG